MRDPETSLVIYYNLHTKPSTQLSDWLSTLLIRDEGRAAGR